MTRPSPGFFKSSSAQSHDERTETFSVFYSPFMTSSQSVDRANMHKILCYMLANDDNLQKRGQIKLTRVAFIHIVVQILFSLAVVSGSLLSSAPSCSDYR